MADQRSVTITALKLRFVAILISFYFGAIATNSLAASEDEIFRQAVSYIFLGNVNGDPFPAPGSGIPMYRVSLTAFDREACVAVTQEQGVSFKFQFRKIVAFSLRPELRAQSGYSLLMEGDDPFLERRWRDNHFDLHKQWAIYLHGNLERTKSALDLIFSKYCPTEMKRPF